MKFCLMIALSIAAPLLSNASIAATLEKPGIDAATVAHLKQLSDNWDKAIVAKNRPAIEANMRDDFRQIDSAGEVLDKKTFVEGLVDPTLTINPYTVEEFDVRIYGDVALLSGRTHMTGTSEGKPFTTDYRYIDIYVQMNHVWKIVSVQTTKIRKP